MRNARFWTWTDAGWVKITLKPHTSVETAHADDCDGEGYSCERDHWSHTGDCVIHSWSSEGRDCDGPFGHYSVSAAALDELASVEVDDGTMIPKWESVSASQYDAFAEAAGY